MTIIKTGNPIDIYPKGDSAYVLAVDGGYEGTLEEFEADLISAVESVDQSGASAAAALVSELAAKESELLAEADKVQTGLDRVATGQDRIATAADRVQTGLDRTATGEDRVATGLDVIATNADVLLTHADVTQTGLDRVATGQDRVATGQDRVQTGLDVIQTGQDRTATGQDRVQTGLDAQATAQDAIDTAADVVLTHADVVLTNADVLLTHADVTQTGLDRVATGQDRVQTGLDRVATGADRTAASGSAATASTKASEASDSAATALLLASAIEKGTWNALTNTPTLTSNQVGAAVGWKYIVSVAGNGYVEQDWTIYNGTTWVRVPKTLALWINNIWQTAIDFAGNSANIIRLSKDNLIEFGGAVNLAKLFHVLNQGLVDIVDIPVSADSAAGAEHGIGITVGGTRILKVYCKSDGAGSIDTIRIEGQKTLQTSVGGFAIKMTNKTGGATVKGTVVAASSATDNAVMVNPIDGDMPLGVILESGIANGSECWVIISGIAEVLIKDATAATRSYVAYSSATTAGRMDIAATVPAAATHFREIGHTIESKTSGTSVLVKCVLHFN